MQIIFLNLIYSLLSFIYLLWFVYSFLVAYMIGTMFLMGLAAGLVGEGTCWIQQQLGIYHQTNNISDRLAVLSSVVAFSIGLFWVLVSAIKYCTTQMDVNTVAQLLENNDGIAEHNHHQYNNMSHQTHLDIIVSSISVISVIGVVLVAIYKEYGLLCCDISMMMISKRTHIHVV